MPNSMVHWNKHQLVAMAIKTTHPDPDWGEMCQISCLALDSNGEIRRDVIPATMNIQCDYPERRDDKHCKKKDFIMTQKHSPLGTYQAEELLLKWIEKLDLKFTKYGNQKRVMVLGYKTYQMIPWLKKWLTLEFEPHFFEHEFRDIQQMALYLNDVNGHRCEDIQYPHTHLTQLTRSCNEERGPRKDTLEECQTVAAIYRKLIKRGTRY